MLQGDLHIVLSPKRVLDDSGALQGMITNVHLNNSKLCQAGAGRSVTYQASDNTCP